MIRPAQKLEALSLCSISVMKKQRWYYSRSRSSSAPPTPAVNVGCMSMVHHLIFTPRPPPSLSSLSDRPSSPSPGQGTEAPRNSLEMDTDQIEPPFDALLPGRRSRATAPSSEAETPSLIARLMGIDGLPDQQPSPSPGLNKPMSTRSAGVQREDRSTSTVKEKKKRAIPESMNKERRQPLRSLSCNVAGDARSLPDTPRASTSARDVLVDRPRLSLQVLKERVLDRAAQYMSMPSSPTSCDARKKKDTVDGYRRRVDAKEHARQIVKNAKETVTNRKKPPTSSNKENASPFVEDKLMVVQAASSKPTTPSPRMKEEQQPHAPRLPPPPPLHRAKPSRPPPPPPPDHPAPPSRSAAALPQQAVKCKGPPDGCERFATRIKKPAAAATSHQVAPASTPSTGAPASSSADHRRTALEDDPEYSYLRSVLERGGFMRATPSSCHRPFKGHSVASPVDPIVFHLMELELPTDDPGPLRHRWNRKLLFHLTQEILAELLLGVDPSRPLLLHGAALLRKVWDKVKAFPAADCRVVGDIDALVATDLHAASLRGMARQQPAVADDVAERILDELLAGECC